MAVLADVAARADADVDATAAALATPAAAGLTLSEIRDHAEAVAAQLRAMNEALADESVIAELEREVLQYRQRISDRWATTDRVVEGVPRRALLEALASAWRSLRIELTDLQAVVDARAHRREADLRTLDGLHRWWSISLAARQADTPAPIVTSEEETLAAIDATRALVDRRNARLLVLQDSLSRSHEDCDDALARIDDARRRAVASVFTQRQPPIWQLRDAWAQQEGMPGRWARLSSELALRLDSLTVYLHAYARGTAFTLLLFVIAGTALYRARARLARETSTGAALGESAAAVVGAPLATAVILTLFFTRPLRPDPPWAMAQITGLIVLPTALYLLKPLMDARIAPAINSLMLLLLLDVGRGLLMATPLLNQIVLIVEMVAAAALLLWIGTRVPASEPGAGGQSPRLRAAVRALCRVVGVISAAAAVAAMLGYVELADFVGAGGLNLVLAAVVLLSVRVAAAGALGLALVLTPLARLHMVQARRAVVERAINAALDIVVVVFWMSLALRIFELVEPAGDALASVLGARLQVGSLDLSVSSTIGFIAIVVGAWFAARFVVFALEEDVYPRVDLPRGVPYALSTLIRYGLLLVGFFLALGMLGLDLTRMTILVSAFGLGVGFGLQQIINNFVSGLILLFERPVQVGDSVQLGDLNGQMVRIGIRSSTIRTGDGAEVIVPNSKLIEERVTNWTLSDRRRRVDLAVRAPNGTDGAQMLALLLDVAGRDARVLREPPPEALFTGFFEKDLEFQLRVWTEDPRWMQLRSALGVAVQDALRNRPAAP